MQKRMRFDAIKTINGERGQMAAGVFVGPYATGMTAAGAGEGEQTAVRGLIRSAVDEVLRPCKLIDKTLFLLDSLYGDGPTLDQLESYRGALHRRSGQAGGGREGDGQSVRARLARHRCRSQARLGFLGRGDGVGPVRSMAGQAHDRLPALAHDGRNYLEPCGGPDQFDAR
jgi:hypothetical protein